MDKIRRANFIIKGYVQGVGFRYFVMQEARLLGLKGTVRNLPSGEVEVIAEGEELILKQLLISLKKGPPLARVSGIQETWNDVNPYYQDFKIEH